MKNDDPTPAAAYFFAPAQTPLGPATLASDGERLAGLWFDGQKHFGGALSGRMIPGDGLPIFDAARGWLARYFAGERPDPRELPLAPVGTPFQRLVWSLLLEIPYGQTASYGALAREAARRTGRESAGARAVGAAVGRNPISVVIPCHRVLAASGALCGYAGGLERKARLLALEGAVFRRED